MNFYILDMCFFFVCLFFFFSFVNQSSDFKIHMSKGAHEYTVFHGVLVNFLDPKLISKSSS